jgi:hypothetical protein
MGWSLHRKTGLTFHSPAQSFKGYTLITPIGADFSALLDMDGRVVHRWHQPGFRVFNARLLPSGTLLSLCTDASLPPPQQTTFTDPPLPFAQHVRRLGGNATHMRELDWDANTLWEYRNEAMHHDFARAPDGSTWVAEWAELPEELARRVRGGARRRGERFPPMLSDELVRLGPDGSEQQRIKLWQLLDPVRDAICPLETRWEWTHLNSLALSADGQLMVSCRTNSLVASVDPDAGSFRWKVTSPTVYHQHHATWLDNGNVQVFDNGMHRIGTPFSRVVEIEPATGAVAWEYMGEPPEQFFSGHISGAERQPNGNVLVCEGASGRIFEISRRGETVWEWTSPFVVNTAGRMRAWVFRAHRYAPDHAALRNRALDPAEFAAFNRLYGL